MAQQSKTDVTIAILGGGGRYWAASVIMDLALCPHLTGELRLHGHRRPPNDNVSLGETLFAHPKSKTSFRLSATTDLGQALSGADVVVIGIAPGPGSLHASDLEVCTRYGVLHTVGDTTGPAGIARALRTIPLHHAYAEAIAEHAPQAWVINYTNPMTLATAALYAGFPAIKAFGCCHEVFGTQKLLAQMVSEARGIPLPQRQEIALDVAGVNHFTFATTAAYRGESLFPLLDERIAAPDFFSDQSDYARHNAASGAFWDHRAKVACDYYRRFGALGAAGDRHLVEFVPWYLSGGEAELHRWGVVATPASFRAGTWQPAPGVERAPNPLDHGDIETNGPKASGEEGVAQICALLGIFDLDTNVNLPNVGQLPQLPMGAIVETNAQFRHNQLRPITPTPMPTAVAGLVRRISEVQQISLQAGIERDFDLALQAVLLDPLTTIGTDAGATMLAELLAPAKEAGLLPGW